MKEDIQAGTKMELEEKELALSSYREMHETANKLLAEKEKEIERLKGLIQKVCNENFRYMNTKNRRKAMEQFKIKNNL